MNLTRFNLFFPEKREFFLEDAGVFAFSNAAVVAPQYLSPARAQVIPFFSRRVGLSANATPQKIDFGTKLTGQVGAQDVGLLHVRTGEDDGFASEDFTVARVKRRVLSQS